MSDRPTIPGTNASFEASRVVLFGAPFDGTCSWRPGTKDAPSAVRREFYGIEDYSPELGADLSDVHDVCDFGDAEIPQGASPSDARDAIGRLAGRIVGSGRIPLMIGGEHAVTLPVVETLLKRYPDLRILHFDAHADLRPDYLGEPLSHASVMRRIWDLVGDGRIAQFGIRSGDRSEFRWAAEGHTRLVRDGFDGLGRLLRRWRGAPLYVSVDLDVLDPSVFPGTGTPEPGGVGFRALSSALSLALRGNVVGCDLVELSPGLDPSGISVAAACKLLREAVLLLSRA
jgi:agmatinase